MLKLILFRHGHAESNVAGRLGRMTSSPLTELGYFQAAKLGEYWKATGECFDYIFSSTAIRAYETARTACKVAGITTPIVQDERLLEIDRGEGEGKRARDVLVGKTRRDWLENPRDFRFPRGESEKEVEERMVKWLEEKVMLEIYCPWQQRLLSEQNSKKAEDEDEEKCLRIAVVTHGLALKCLLRHWLGADYTAFCLSVDNSSKCEVHYDGQRWRIIAINRTTHLHASPFHA